MEQGHSEKNMALSGVWRSHVLSWRQHHTVTSQSDIRLIACTRRVDVATGVGRPECIKRPHSYTLTTKGSLNTEHGLGERGVGSGNLLRAAWNEVGVMGQDSVNWSSSAILTVKQIRRQQVTTRLARFQIHAHHRNAANTLVWFHPIIHVHVLIHMQAYSKMAVRSHVTIFKLTLVNMHKVMSHGH